MSRSWSIEAFDRWYNLLSDFINVHQRIPQYEEKFRGRRLGVWCSTIRRNYKEEFLPSLFIDKINTLPIWRWDGHYDTNWDNEYRALIEYVYENKKLPKWGEKMLCGRAIGRWCASQRQRYKWGTLSQCRIKKLEQINLWYW
jgi:hypothetical protein